MQGKQQIKGLTNFIHALRNCSTPEQEQAPRAPADTRSELGWIPAQGCW